jgi:hypothetical protein
MLHARRHSRMFERLTRSLVPFLLLVQLQNEWDTTYFNVANMDNMATDIGQLVEMELKSQAITTRPALGTSSLPRLTSPGRSC